MYSKEVRLLRRAFFAEDILNISVSLVFPQTLQRLSYISGVSKFLSRLIGQIVITVVIDFELNRNRNEDQLYDSRLKHTTFYKCDYFL